MKDSIKNLLKVKSIITLVLTLVFGVLLITGIFLPVAIPQEFTMIYTTIIGFYFGTQFQKGKDSNGKTAEDTDPS